MGERDPPPTQPIAVKVMSIGYCTGHQTGLVLCVPTSITYSCFSISRASIQLPVLSVPASRFVLFLTK
ncbi:hypothetical protein V6N13_145245 [Hibiscus sabdariffa]